MTRIRDLTRRALGLLLFCVLVLAPVIISATHAPGLPGNDTQLSERVSHGHSHDEIEPDRSGNAHDATDHEHQTKMILPRANDTVFTFGAPRPGMSEVSDDGLGPSGHRRPPREMLV